MSTGSEAYRRNPAERRLSRTLVWLVFAGATAGTLIALLSRSHWIAELFSHYRVYYLIAQGLLLMVFLNTRRYLWLVATLALAVPNAWFVTPYLLPVIRDALAGEPIVERPQMLAVNLNYRNDNYAAFIDYVQGLQPEVIVLAEYTPAWDRALRAELEDYPHRQLRPRPTPFGIAVYSRVPLEDPVWLDLDAPGSANLRARLSLAGRQLELFAVHLYPPTNAERAAWRQQQLRALTAELQRARSPRVVVGDLNLTPFSPLFEDLLKNTGLLDARRRQGLHVTWPSSPLPLWIPIDHCLADVSGGVINVKTGPGIGSDHYPLEITLSNAG